MDTMVAPNRQVRFLGAFLNPEVVDVTLTAEEEREKRRRQREGPAKTPTIQGLGIIPFVRPGVETVAFVGVGLLSATLSGVGAWASFRAIGNEKATFWKIVHGALGVALVGNTIGSTLLTLGGLAVSRRSI